MISHYSDTLKKLVHELLQDLYFTRTLTDKNRISTGDVTHEFRTNRIVTDSYRTSNGRLSPFCPVESFEHVQNFPPDRTDKRRQAIVSQVFI